MVCARKKTCHPAGLLTVIDLSQFTRSPLLGRTVIGIELTICQLRSDENSSSFTIVSGYDPVSTRFFRGF